MRAVIGGLTLDAEACRLLFELANLGLNVVRARDGYAPVPASTSSLLNVIAAGAGMNRASVPAGTAWDGDPVPGARSGHADTYTATEAAERWGVTPSLVRRYCRDGRVRAVKDGGGWSIPGDYVREHTRPPRPETGDSDEQG